MWSGRVKGRLVLSEKTVRNYASAMLVKLQVPDRATAVAKGPRRRARHQPTPTD